MKNKVQQELQIRERKKNSFSLCICYLDRGPVSSLSC